MSSQYEIAKQLMPYTGKVAWPTIILFLCSVAVYVIAIILGSYDIIPLWSVAMVNTLMAYLLFTPLHEAGHGNISDKKGRFGSLEKIIGWLSGFPLMAPYPIVTFLHHEHHKHTNDPRKDPDYYVAATNYFMLFFKCMTIYYDYIYQYFKKSKMLISDRAHRKNYIVSVLFMIFFNTIVIFWGLKSGWLYPLSMVILPAYLALGFLALAFDWLPHHPHAVQQKYLDTRIILKPGLTLLLVSQNMHLIHHLYSGIPFYHYGRALKILKPHLTEKGAKIIEKNYHKV
ncbi:MAG: fatty acid desaturase [Cyclobacteriaceae bacterium]